MTTVDPISMPRTSKDSGPSVTAPAGPGAGAAVGDSGADDSVAVVEVSPQLRVGAVWVVSLPGVESCTSGAFLITNP
jgi:hypothetical protein